MTKKRHEYIDHGKSDGSYRQNYNYGMNGWSYCQNPICATCQDKRKMYITRKMHKDSYLDMLFCKGHCALVYRNYPGKRIKNSIYL